MNGALLAEGRPEASIEFGSHQESADCAPWSGVAIAAGSRGALLRHVWLVGASTALTVTGNAVVVVEKCAFDDWQTAAVVYNSPGALTIRQSSFGLSSSFGPLPAITPTVVVGAGAAAAVVIEHCVFAGRFADAGSTNTPGPTIRASTFQYDATTACAAEGAPSLSRLKINEIVASQTRLVTDRRGYFEDYIELFNPSDSELDLTGYTLVADDNRNSCEDPLPLVGLKIAARGFLLVWADDDGYQGLNHAPFKLAKHGGTIRLYDGTGTEVETVPYPVLEDNQAYGRAGDGCGAWAVLEAASPGRANAALLPSGETSRVACLRGNGVIAIDTAARRSAPELSQSPAQVVGPPPPPVPCSALDDCGCTAADSGWSGSTSSCTDGGHTSVSEAAACRANNGGAPAGGAAGGIVHTVPAGCVADVSAQVIPHPNFLSSDLSDGLLVFSGELKR